MVIVRLDTLRTNVNSIGKTVYLKSSDPTVDNKVPSPYQIVIVCNNNDYYVPTGT